MRISDWSSDVCSSDLKWLEGGDTRRDDHLRGAAVLAEWQIEIVEDGEILQPVGWLDQQRGAEAVVVLVLEIAAAAEILDLSVAAVDPAGDAQRDLAVDEGNVERAIQCFRVKVAVARLQVAIEPIARRDLIDEDR